MCSPKLYLSIILLHASAQWNRTYLSHTQSYRSMKDSVLHSFFLMRNWLFSSQWPSDGCCLTWAILSTLLDNLRRFIKSKVLHQNSRIAKCLRPTFDDRCGNPKKTMLASERKQRLRSVLSVKDNPQEHQRLRTFVKEFRVLPTVVDKQHIHSLWAPHSSRTVQLFSSREWFAQPMLRNCLFFCQNRSWFSSSQLSLWFSPWRWSRHDQRLSIRCMIYLIQYMRYPRILIHNDEPHISWICFPYNVMGV